MKSVCMVAIVIEFPLLLSTTLTIQRRLPLCYTHPSTPSSGPGTEIVLGSMCSRRSFARLSSLKTKAGRARTVGTYPAYLASQHGTPASLPLAVAAHGNNSYIRARVYVCLCVRSPLAIAPESLGSHPCAMMRAKYLTLKTWLTVTFRSSGCGWQGDRCQMTYSGSMKKLCVINLIDIRNEQSENIVNFITNGW